MEIIVGTSKSHSYFTSPLIKVIVEGDTDSVDAGITFYIHASLLIPRSVFFVKALRNYATREGEEGIVKLPVDDPDVFAAYAHLIYFGVLPIDDEDDENDKDYEDDKDDGSDGHDINSAIARSFDLLAKLYVLCEKICDEEGKQTLLAVLVEASSICRGDKCHHIPGRSTIRYIYAHTLALDPLREIVVDYYAYEGSTEWLSKHDEHPHEFRFDVVAKILELGAEAEAKSTVEDAEYYRKKLEELEKSDIVGGDGSEARSEGQQSVGRRMVRYLATPARGLKWQLKTAWKSNKKLVSSLVRPKI